MADVKIVCAAWGRDVPREVGEAGAAEGPRARRAAFELEGHAVRWEVGPVVAADQGRLARVLEALEREVDVVVVRPGPGTCVADVVTTVDRLVEAGVGTVRFAEEKDVRLCAVEREERSAEVIPAASRSAEKAQEYRWQPVLRIDQRGVVAWGDEVVYEPERDREDVKGLREGLGKIVEAPQAQSLLKGERTAAGLREYVDVPLRLETDRWTEWYWVERVLEAAAGRFRGVEIAVQREEAPRGR